MPLPCRSFQAVAVKEEQGRSEVYVRAIKQATERKSGVERLRACDLQCNPRPQPHWVITTCKLGKVSPQLQPAAHAPTCQRQRAHQTFSQLRPAARLMPSRASRAAGTCGRSFSGWHTSLCCRLWAWHQAQSAGRSGKRSATMLPRASFAACTVRVVPTRCPPMQRCCPHNAPVGDLAFAGAVCERGQGMASNTMWRHACHEKSASARNSCCAPTSHATHRPPCSVRTAGTAAPPLAAFRSLQEGGAELQKMAARSWRAHRACFASQPANKPASQPASRAASQCSFGRGLPEASQHVCHDPAQSCLPVLLHTVVYSS